MILYRNSLFKFLILNYSNFIILSSFYFYLILYIIFFNLKIIFRRKQKIRRNPTRKCLRERLTHAGAIHCARATRQIHPRRAQGRSTRASRLVQTGQSAHITSKSDRARRRTLCTRNPRSRPTRYTRCAVGSACAPASLCAAG